MVSYENDHIGYSLGIPNNNENSPHELSVELGTVDSGVLYIQQTIPISERDKEEMASTKQYWREKYNNKDFPQNVRNTMK